MLIEAADTINFPAKLAFTAYRDELEALAAYVPNVKEVKVEDRKVDSAGNVSFVNHWHADAPIPTILKAIISPKMLQWYDYATWYEDGMYAEWRLEPFFLKSNVKVTGRTSFTPAGDARCSVGMKINMDFNLDNVPGIPGLLRNKAVDAVEKLCRSLILPNLQEINKSLNTFLTDKAKKA